MPTLAGGPDPGGKLKLEHALEPGRTLEHGDASEPGGAPELRRVSEPGGTLDLGDASELGAKDPFVSAPKTPQLVLEEIIPRHRRAVFSDREQRPCDGEIN